MLHISRKLQIQKSNRQGYLWQMPNQATISRANRSEQMSNRPSLLRYMSRGVSFAKKKASQTGRNHGYWQVTKSGHSSRSCAKPNDSKDYGSKYH
jgi:hypothetical protein